MSEDSIEVIELALESLTSLMAAPVSIIITLVYSSGKRERIVINKPLNYILEDLHDLYKISVLVMHLSGIMATNL